MKFTTKDELINQAIKVTNRYLFWFDDEGKECFTFEIDANDSNEAYEKAYDTY